MNRVPVIDLTPAREGNAADRLAVARDIDEACRGIGFFAISGHGVATASIERLRRIGHAFFALPLETKLKSAHPVKGTNRGYHAIADESLAASGDDQAAPADYKEYYHVGPVDVGTGDYYTAPRGQEFFRPNIWPVEPADFAAAATDYYRTMDRLELELFRLAALGLGVDEHFFDDKVNRTIGTMRLNYYPAQTTPPLPGQLRAGAHTDYGGMTILNGEDVPGGLQVRTRSGDWIDVRTAPDQFVINIGDLLMRWTNDRWLSNPHRVANPPLDPAQNRPRLSIAFFNHPNWDLTVECIAPPGQAKHPPVNSGDYLDMKYGKTGLRTTTAAAE